MVFSGSPTYYRDLIVSLTKKELKVRYKRSFLGYLWSLANPLALAIVFFIAFKVVMRISIENYTLFLIAGLFPWQWFANSVTSSPLVLLGNASLIKKVNFPREILVVVSVLNDMFHFILSIPVIVLFLFHYGLQPSFLWLIGIPLLLTVQFILVCGLSLFFSSLNLLFRDLERLVVIFTTLLFYLTPIIYAEAMIPEGYREVLLLVNPVAPLFVTWRELFMEGTLNLKGVAVSGLYAIAVLFIGEYVFRRLRWKFAEVL